MKNRSHRQDINKPSLDMDLNIVKKYREKLAKNQAQNQATP